MARRKKGRVGILGLGIMGGAFARNLVRAGWTVVGYDPDATAAGKARKGGIEIAKDVRALAAAVPVIITSLPDPKALHAIVRTIAKAELPHRTIVEASTFTLKDKQKAERSLRDAGHTMLDCPVSGTGAQARTRDIVVYASGPKATIRRLQPLFAGFSRLAPDLGAFGNGSKMKYVANLLVAIHNVASAEAMVLGMKAGLAPQQIFDLISAGAGNSRVFELRAPMMVKNDYSDATMKMSVWQKDMKVIGAFARTLGVPTPLFSATQPVYARALASGLGAKDTAAVCAVLEKKARVRRKG